MKRLYFIVLFAALLCICGCSPDKPNSGADSLPTQESSASTGSDIAASSYTESDSTETTTSSQPNESTAGISPTTNTRSDVQSAPATGGHSPETPQRPNVQDKDTPTKNQTNSKHPGTAEPPKDSEISSTNPTASSNPAPPAESTTPPTSSPEPDMEAEYARIIRETVAYAESYAAKGFTFVWDDSLEFSWESGAGWMGTPRVKYEGVDGTIEMLKYHIDKIVKIAGGPGTPGYSAYYKVMQVTVDGDIAFVVLYG